MLRAVCTRAQVQRLNESRLTIRGMGIRTLSPLRRFRQGPSYSPNRLVSQSATLKTSAHSFKQFTSRLLKSTFSLSLCTYITRMDFMLDFICMGPVDLPGARRKRQNTKLKNSCPQWDSNPQPFDSKSDALPTELAGLGECYQFK